MLTSVSCPPCPALIHTLQQKLAPHGVKLSIPGLQGGSDAPPPSGEPSEPGLLRLLTLLCGLEFNGNLHSELEQVVQKERLCLLKDELLQGLLVDDALRHCLDITVENSTPGRIKVLEVRLSNIWIQLDYFHTLIMFTSLQALSDDGQLFSRVVPLLNIQPTLRVDYTATAPRLELLAPHQAPLEELGVAAAQWDPLTGPAAGDVAVGADLVLCNHAWGPVRTEPRLLVANLASAAKESGFVLLHTLLKGETVGEAVAFLSRSAQSSSQQRLLTQVCLHTTSSQPV